MKPAAAAKSMNTIEVILSAKIFTAIISRNETAPVVIVSAFFGSFEKSLTAASIIRMPTAIFMP